MAQTTLPASDNRLVSQPVCGFLCRFGRQVHVDVVRAFRMDAAIAGFHSAGLLVDDIVGHDARVTISAGVKLRSFVNDARNGANSYTVSANGKGAGRKDPLGHAIVPCLHPVPRGGDSGELYARERLRISVHLSGSDAATCQRDQFMIGGTKHG